MDNKQQTTNNKQQTTNNKQQTTNNKQQHAPKSNQKHNQRSEQGAKGQPFALLCETSLAPRRRTCQRRIPKNTPIFSLPLEHQRTFVEKREMNNQGLDG
jgi:hypothetical protein